MVACEAAAADVVRFCDGGWSWYSNPRERVPASRDGENWNWTGWTSSVVVVVVVV